MRLRMGIDLLKALCEEAAERRKGRIRGFTIKKKEEEPEGERIRVVGLLRKPWKERGRLELFSP